MDVLVAVSTRGVDKGGLDGGVGTMCGLLRSVDRARQRIGGVVRVISLAQRNADDGENAMEVAISSGYRRSQ